MQTISQILIEQVTSDGVNWAEPFIELLAVVGKKSAIY